MKYLSSFKLSIPKRAVFVTLGLLLFCGLVAYGMVRDVQKRQLDAANAALVAQVQSAKDKAVQSQLDALKAQLNNAKADNAAICDWVRAIAPKYRFSVPPKCQLH